MNVFQQAREEEDELRKRNQSKEGNYTGKNCPQCNRNRLMMGDDGKQRCEKCAYCVEDEKIDGEFQDYLNCK
jgi:hypothetical protein